MIEQNANLALKTAHRGYVMENGEITLSDTAANLLANEDIKKPIWKPETNTSETPCKSGWPTFR